MTIREREDKWREFYFRVETASRDVAEASRDLRLAEERLKTALSLAPHVEGPPPL